MNIAVTFLLVAVQRILPPVLGATIAQSLGMRTFITRYCNAAMLAAALVAPVAMTTGTLMADERHYHDKGHNDDHVWNAHEDRAYRIWVKENHRKYRDFAKIREEDRESYWAWRHEHSDALLKIDIR